MSILDMRSNAAPAANAAAPQARETAKVWLNVGVYIDNPKEPGTQIFVSLPVGIPLDTMKFQEVRGSSEDFAHLVQAKNQLLKDLQDASKDLPAGQSGKVGGLKVEVRRVAEQQEALPGDGNSIASAVSAALKIA